MTRRPARFFLLFAVFFLASLVACDRHHPAIDSSLPVLTRIPLSPELKSAVDDARERLDEPLRQDGVAPMMAAYLSLMERIQRPDTRTTAGEELYDLWREAPENFLWISLAVRQDYILRRRAERDSMLALPALVDTSTAVGNFGRGWAARRAARSAFFSRAGEKSDELDPLPRIILECRLARIDKDEGRGADGVHRLLRHMATAEEIGGCRVQMLLWFGIARILQDLDRLDDALHAASMSLAQAEKAGSSYWAIFSRLRIGRILEARKEDAAALGIFERCAQQSRDESLAYAYKSAMSYIAMMRFKQRDFTGTLAAHREIYSYSLATGDSLNALGQLLNIGKDFIYLGQPDSCRAWQLRARRWLEISPNERIARRLPQFEAEYFSYVGDYAAVDSVLGLAMDLSEGQQLATEEASLLLSVVREALVTGDTGLAYRTQRRLAELRDLVVDTQINLNLSADIDMVNADVYMDQGDFRRAAESLERARQSIDPEVETSRAWYLQRRIGRLALLRSDIVAARRAFERGLELARQGGEPTLLSQSRLLLGHALIEGGHFAEFEEVFAEQRQAEVFGSPFFARLATTILRGVASSRAGRTEEALEWFAVADEFATASSPPDLLTRLDLEAGRALARTGQPAKARLRLLQSLEILESGELRAHSDDLPFESIESYRAVIAEVVGVIGDNPELAGDSGVALATLEFADRLFRREYLGARAGARPARPLSNTGRNATVAYLVGEDHSFRWMIADGDIEWCRLPGRDGLSRLVQPVLVDMSHPGRVVDDHAVAALSDLLLSGIDRKWDADATLTIVADDILQSLPWAALTLGGASSGAQRAALIDHGPFVLAPSLSTRRDDMPQRRPADLGLLALGADGAPDASLDEMAPILHEAEAEARDVAACWRGPRAEYRTGADAGWTNVVDDDATAFDVLHIASHATVYPGRPERSIVRLVGDRRDEALSLATINQLELDRELVYLSCCHASRRIGSRRGMGIAGFTRAFLRAGSRAVIASSVRVADDAAREMAVDFYEQWQAGASPAEALRKARQAIRDEQQWRHPFYWAFVDLYGNGPV